MIDERTAAAAILGELIPELEYAAPVFLERLERGQPLVERRSPSDLELTIATIDPQLLELFRALAPLVTTAVSCGILVIQKKSLAEIARPWASFERRRLSGNTAWIRWRAC